jgi:hypothetical protein
MNTRQGIINSPAISRGATRYLYRHQPNGFHSKISFGSTVSDAKRAMNIADAINTPK